MAHLSGISASIAFAPGTFASGAAYWDSLCHWSARMNVSLSLGPLAALIAGILILILPRLLNYIVAIYLILIGLVGLFGARL